MIVYHFWPEKIHALPKVSLSFIKDIDNDWVIISNEDSNHKGEIVFKGIKVKYCNPSLEDYTKYKDVFFCGSLFGVLYFNKIIKNSNKFAILTSKKYKTKELLSIRLRDIFVSKSLLKNLLTNISLKLIPNYFLRKSIQSYKKIYVPSNYFVNETRKIVGDHSKIMLLGLERKNSTRKIHKSHKKFKILFVGHSYITRGLDVLALVFDSIMKEHSLKDVELNIVVNPMYEREKELNYIKKVLKKVSSYKNVNIKLEYVGNLNDYYQDAHILVYPYRYLPDILAYPLVILEAKSYGCKIITSNFPNNLEIVDSNDYIINPKSIKELKNAILVEYNKFKGEKNDV